MEDLKQEIIQSVTNAANMEKFIKENARLQVELLTLQDRYNEMEKAIAKANKKLLKATDLVNTNFAIGELGLLLIDAINLLAKSQLIAKEA